jgi:hypothetical protein
MGPADIGQEIGSRIKVPGTKYKDTLKCDMLQIYWPGYK